MKLHRRILPLVTLAVLLLNPPASWAQAAAACDPAARDKLFGAVDCEPGSREWLRSIEAARYRALPEGGRMDNCPHSFDVLHYDITLGIDFDNQLINGDTRVLSVSETAALSSITLDLRSLAVDSVWCDEQPAAFAYVSPILTVELGQTCAPGDSFEVRVLYHGHPANEGPGGFGGFYFAGNPLMAFQMGVGLVADPPSMGKCWFPCWDWPCDKATAGYHITVPDGRQAVCNGVLVGLDARVDTRSVTYHWSETHEISPHVMSVAARTYTELIDPTYDWIHYWVFPAQAGNAPTHFENVDVMMDGFISRYGPYPFSRFGYAVATKGDMEHQTCVTHLNTLVQPNHTYDWLLAHEMSHQWWGDCVSVNDWRDVWLSEGFATYSEAIFQEYAYGMPAYHAYMTASLMAPVLASAENFPIYDPDYLWGTTTYEKGGTVLHMLRHVIGDEDFFASLANYRAAYEYQSAITPQFRDAVETTSGQALDWFFDEWIYDVGWPDYDYAWQATSTADGYDLSLVIAQVQTNGPIFTMPLDVKVTTLSGDTLVTLWVDAASESFVIPIADEPQVVTLDPDDWMLNHAELVAYATVAEAAWRAPGLSLAIDGSNPSRAGVTLQYSLARPQRIEVTVFDVSGQRVRSLLDGPVPSAAGTLTWDGLDEAGRPVAAGTYFCRLRADDWESSQRVVLLR
jgi:aminopeptidase N